MREQLSDAIDNYLRFRRSQDYAENTVRSDQQVLKRFLSVNGNVWMHVIGERHVERHFEEVSRTRKNATLRNDHGVLDRFFKWARHTRRMPMDANPMFGRRQPKSIQRERNRVHVTQFPRLLDAAERRSPRDRILIALLLYTLMRDSEVTDLRLRDIDLEGGWITARIKKSRLEDRMPICEELDFELRKWLTTYTEHVGVLEPSYFLTPARDVRPIHDGRGRISGHHQGFKPLKRIATAGRIVVPVLDDIGFPVLGADGKPCGEGAHTIRRSGARALFDDLSMHHDYASRVVQSMLHHASVKETERYLGITADRRSRDEIIRHKRMYAASDENVVRLAR